MPTTFLRVLGLPSGRANDFFAVLGAPSGPFPVAGLSPPYERLVVHVRARPAGGDAVVARFWPVSRADGIDGLSALSLRAGVLEPCSS